MGSALILLRPIHMRDLNKAKFKLFLNRIIARHMYILSAGQLDSF